MPFRAMTWLVFSLFAGCLLTSSADVRADRLDELSLDRWAKLREVERYQLNIAEKYYRDRNHKVAAAEYEKFLTLYETSEGAAYSQLKWSLCMVELRKHNTAIKEGFQSVIDYWPDSPEAVAASYYIGRAFKDIGEVRRAKKAYQTVLEDHAKHIAAVYATVDLIDLTTIDDDIKTRVKLWKRLTFDTARSKESRTHCQNASIQLAAWSFESASLDEAVKALETSYSGSELIGRASESGRRAIRNLISSDETKARGEKLADSLTGWIRSQAAALRADGAGDKAILQCWYLMADVQAATGRDAEVRQIYDDLVSSFGADDDTLLRIGNWYKSIDRFDDARKHFAKFGNQLEGQNQIATSFRQQRKFPQAVQAYERNAAADMENTNRWYSEIANTWREAGKYDEAIAVYTELLQSDPENADKWLWMIAASYRDSGRHKEAIGYYRQCNNFPSNYQEMARCHRALQEYGEAVILYNQIVGGSPKSAPWAMLQIGYTHEQANKKEAAIRAFQQVCKQFPKDRYASQAHAHLQSKYRITVTLGGAKDDK